MGIHNIYIKTWQVKNFKKGAWTTSKQSISESQHEPFMSVNLRNYKKESGVEVRKEIKHSSFNLDLLCSFFILRGKERKEEKTREEKRREEKRERERERERENGNCVRKG